jgi:hypothetical protein
VPCPNPKNYSGSDHVDANLKKSRLAAAAAVRALVASAAKSACIQKALSEGLCPSDCPYPQAFNVHYTITSVTTSPHHLVNIVAGWFSRIFAGHWWYGGRAHFTYRGFVRCTNRQVSYAVMDDIESETEAEVA